MKNTVNFWDGNGLPPIGSYVGYKTASGGDNCYTTEVLGYEIQPHLDGDDAYHRVFVVFEGNTRLLKHCFCAFTVGLKEGGE